MVECGTYHDHCNDKNSDTRFSNAEKATMVCRTALQRRTLLSGMFASVVVGCGAPEHLVGLPSSDALPDFPPELRKHTIMIATTRALSQEDGVLFSGDRSETLNFGTVDVYVPPNHTPGQVERPRRLPPDPLKHFTIQNSQVLDSASFRDIAYQNLLSRARSRRKLMVWIHGYNSTLTDALLRLAQFLEDTGYDGIPLLYSWASAGKVTRYVYDINSALAARDGLVAIGVSLAQSPVESIDIVAHSMGNLLTMEAIRSQGRVDLFNSSGKLSNVILAAPDIDLDLFASQVRSLRPDQRGFFVLISSDDRALRLSRVLASQTRVGQASVEDLTALGVNVIDLSQVDDESTNHHTKFADAPEVVRLIGNRILAGDNFSEASANGLGEAISVGANGVLRKID